MLKKMLVSVLLIGFLVGLPMPVSVGAQGGDAVYKSLGVIGALRVGGTARFEGPVYGVGPQDVASDLLTSSMNVMSSTYTTVMSASVTTSEPGDSVLVHVTGQFRQMFSLYLTTDGGPGAMSFTMIAYGVSTTCRTRAQPPSSARSHPGSAHRRGSHRTAG